MSNLNNYIYRLYEVDKWISATCKNLHFPGVSSGQSRDGAGEAGAEGRQSGHRHGRQPSHRQVT